MTHIVHSKLLAQDIPRPVEFARDEADLRCRWNAPEIMGWSAERQQAYAHETLKRAIPSNARTIFATIFESDIYKGWDGWDQAGFVQSAMGRFSILRAGNDRTFFNQVFSSEYFGKWDTSEQNRFACSIVEAVAPGHMRMTVFDTVIRSGTFHRWGMSEQTRFVEQAFEVCNRADRAVIFDRVIANDMFKTWGAWQQSQFARQVINALPVNERKPAHDKLSALGVMAGWAQRDRLSLSVLVFVVDEAPVQSSADTAMIRRLRLA